jgi:hypothetical protein
MLDENMDLLDRLLWIYLCNEVDYITVERAISAFKEARKNGLWDICKEYLKEELREAASLIASQTIDEYDKKYYHTCNDIPGGEKLRYPTPLTTNLKQEKAKSGCRFSDILG